MSTISRRGFVKTAALAPLAAAPFTMGQQASREDRFDVVVAGAGHNSLVAAAYLAKAGYRCLVLESRALVGGGVKTTQLTLRGFKHDVCSSAHVLIQDSPILRNDELGLGEYGLEYIFPDPVVHIPFPDGSYITQWRDLDRTCEAFAKFSKKDAAAYRRMSFHDPHQAFGGHGAARRVRRGLHRRSGYVEGWNHFVRHSLCLQGAAEVPGDRRHDIAGRFRHDGNSGKRIARVL